MRIDLLQYRARRLRELWHEHCRRQDALWTRYLDGLGTSGADARRALRAPRSGARSGER